MPIQNGSRPGLIGFSFQILQDKKLPRKYSPSTVKIRWRARKFARMWVHGLYAPFLNYGAFFGFLTLPLTIFFMFVLLGEKQAASKFEVLIVAGFALIAAMPIWGLINIIIAAVRLFAEENEIGGWQGDKFIYAQPKQLMTAECTAESIGMEAIFQATDIPPGALVTYKIEKEGETWQVNCIVLGAYFFADCQKHLEKIRFGPRGRVVVRDDNSLRVPFYAHPNHRPTIIRVYALSWEIDSEVMMEFIDEANALSFVIRKPSIAGSQSAPEMIAGPIEDEPDASP